MPTTPARHKFYQLRNLYARMSGKVMADVGCGTGFFASRFAQAGATVFALDASPGNAKLAAELNAALPVTALAGDAHALPFADDSLDAVFCSCVVEHFDNPEAFFAEVHRVLKPAGQFLLTVDIRPKATYWLYRLGFVFDKMYASDHPMLHKHTAISDDRCLEFIDPDKMARLLAPLFETHGRERLCGLNFNLVHGSLVIVNRLHQLLTGGALAEGDYAGQMKILDKPLMRFYSRLLPVIRLLVHPKVLTFDAIYQFQLLRKRPL